MKKNNEKVLNLLKQISQSLSKEKEGLSTIEISNRLNMQRSNVSTALNELVEEGFVDKSNNRPVLYRIKHDQLINEQNSCFDNLIGQDGSLKNAVSLIKAAVLYPQPGFSVLIVGETGTGKSLFAHLIHEFAIEQNVIPSHAPFIRVNCKNYLGHEDKLSEDLFGHKQDNFFEQAEGGFLFIDSVDLLIGKDRSRLIHYIENQELHYLDSDEPKKLMTSLILACNENVNSEIIEYYAQKIRIHIKLPSLVNRPMKERLQLINHFFALQASQAKQTFEVTNEVIRGLMLLELTNNVRQLDVSIRIACANAFVRSRKQLDQNILILISDFNDNLRQGFLNYKKYRDEIERIVPEEYNYVFSSQNMVEKNIGSQSTRESIYEVIGHKMDELKERGLQDEEIDLLTSTHIQTIFDDYQRYLTKQVMNLGQLSKVVDRKIIEEVKQFLDTAQDKFNVMYPMALYYGLALHVGSLLENNGRSQRLGNQQIMQIVSQYNNEYVYCLQFIQHLEKTMNTRIPVDEAVILTMFLVNQESAKSNAKPVLLYCMHGHQTASSLATVINALVQADNTYGFDMSLDSEPMDSYGQLKDLIIRIHQGKGVIVIYDMGSFKDMLLNIAKETGIEIRQLYLPITLLGIDAARRSMLDEDIDNTYHHLLQNIQQIYAQDEYKFKAPILITLCATGEGGAIELKKYIERYSTKPREIIPLAISDRKVLVEKVKALLEVYSIKSFVGTYNPNLFGIPYISIQDVFECPPDKIDQLLEFNPIGEKGLDMEAIYDYLDDSLEFVDIQKIRKYLPSLLDSIENVSNETLDMDQKLGLFIHIASSINRSLSKESSPVNRKREQIFAKFETLTKELARLLKPIERSFGIIVNDDEIANIVCIIKKL